MVRVVCVLETVGVIVWRRWLKGLKRKHEALVALRPTALGTITGNKEVGDDAFNPVISYTVKGTTYSIVHPDNSYIRYVTGVTMAVAYDPERPSDAVVAVFDDSWDQKLTKFLGWCGVLIIIGALTGVLE